MTTFALMALGAACAAVAAFVLRRFLGFAAQSPQDYTTKSPALDLRRHLSGKILCEGVIYGPTGRVTSRFVADMVATWQGDTGTLAEEFRYDTGAVQQRLWHFTLAPDGGIRATAADVIGTATGRQTGPALQMLYRIKLGADAGGHVLDATDWMYLTPNGTIINRSQFRKFGIKVAELVATMRKVDQ